MKRYRYIGTEEMTDRNKEVRIIKKENKENK